jgi:Na+/H+ antiporter NhaA
MHPAGPASRASDEEASGGALSERTPWGRSLVSPLRAFLGTETGGAVALLGATLAALVWANSPWPHSYEAVWTTTLSVHVGDAGISQDLRQWVNDGLMTLFFLVIGLEAKRELDMGQMRVRRNAAVPFVASLGGMATPVGIYLAFNASSPAAHGWGAAMSTDTAFMLGLLALVAPGGARLRVRLLALATFDDLIALVVIATVYTGHVALLPLLVAVGLIAALMLLRHAPDALRARAPIVLGLAAWVALYESRIDPVISGLAVGLVTSAYPPRRDKLARVVELTRSFREQPTPALARSAHRQVSAAISPTERLQYLLHPWTSFVIVPVFALANAGIHVTGGELAQAVRSPITLGILLGYVVGKPVGIAVSATLALRLRVGPRMLSSPTIVGGGIVAGVGFTVALLIASLAFHGQDLENAKLGVLASAMFASVAGWGVFRLIAHLPSSVRARQIARTADDVADLDDDVDPERDHIRGGDQASVTLVEYGDYQCPYCGQAETVVRELLASFGDDLRYVWRHLPLGDVHPHAQIAAEAAEAAAAQGAFWAMHDKLLAHQDELTMSDLVRYARELHLDTGRFRDELQQRVYAELVAEDVASADASGAAGTPAFFVNGPAPRGRLRREQPDGGCARGASAGGVDQPTPRLMPDQAALQGDSSL